MTRTVSTLSAVIVAIATLLGGFTVAAGPASATGNETIGAGNGGGTTQSPPKPA